MAVVLEETIAETVQHYIDSVIDGSIITGKLQRLAIERHIRDLEHGHERGLYFDEAAAEHAIDFFGFLKHSKGEWANQTFVLEPWQQFLIWVLFGWKRSSDGMRRFRTAYCAMARKNGKSQLAAAIGLKLFVADDEPGAEIYTAATKRDQARIIHEEAKRMVKKSPYMLELVDIFRSNMSIPSTDSKYVPLSADAKTLDGLDPSGNIVDEVHAHPNRELLDVLETGTAARRQPLTFMITTAGYDRYSICFEIDRRCIQILEGIIEDDTFFVFICRIDESDIDNWHNEACWIKANPNLNVSVKLDDLQRKAKKAQDTPAALNTFLRLHLNWWTQQSVRWINMPKWNACVGDVDPEALKNQYCRAGLDLASTSDLTAFVLAFPIGDGVKLLPFFWCPEERIRERSRKDRVDYDLWCKRGLIRATPGDITDYAFVRRDIKEIGDMYHVEEIGVDRLFQGAQLATELGQDGFNVKEFGQGFYSMAAPTHQFEILYLSGKLEHGANEVLDWMADNVSVDFSPAGTMKPNKPKSTAKIDGIVAALMAIGLLMAAGEFSGSVYDDGELFVL